ncbi:hypothetical protein [Wandonia haliotis]
MKYWMVVLLVCCQSVFSQTIQERFYDSGELAVRETTTELYRQYGSSAREEKVEVFSKEGNLVFSGSRRYAGGYAMIRLTFYDNGGVERIENEYNSEGRHVKDMILLDRNGNRITPSQPDSTAVIDTIGGFAFPKRPALDAIKSNDLGEKQLMHVWWENGSEDTLIIRVQQKMDPEGIWKVYRLNSGDKVEIGTFDRESLLDDPAEKYILEIRSTKDSIFRKIETNEVQSTMLSAGSKTTYLYHWTGNK